MLLGYGISNQAVKAYFDSRKISYLIYDDYLDEYRQNVDLNSFEVIVKSPIIKNDHWLIRLAKQLNKKIITDLELFFTENPFKTCITVTGTNGKTTTVNLIASLLEDVDLGGNVGVPLFDFIHSPRDIVIEASSFMLEYIDKFHSDYSVFLNFSPNHLDHHADYQEYIRCKMNLLKNCRPNDSVIYNYDDPLLRRLCEDYEVNLIPFSITEPVKGCYWKDDMVYFHDEPALSTKSIHLLGKHNLANITAAVAVCSVYNPDIRHLEKRLQAFQPVEHRLEYIGMYGEAKVYNDSKSTNYRALKTALESFPKEKVLLICGGKTRLDPIDILDDSLQNIAFALTNGENRNLLNQYFEKHRIMYQSYPRLENVLDNLDKYSRGISVILFSPASVSYDQFKNFELRGEYFKERMKPLIGR